MDTDATVFVIDDDQAVRDSLQWLIESVGMRVQAFGSAPPFLEALAAMSDWPRGCLLVDIRLPGMSGLELQAKLRRMNVPLPVIVITGHGDVSMAVRAMKAGAVDFIEKPFDERVLIARIREAIDRQERAQEVRTMREALDQRHARLTPRERQVMQRVVSGHLNKQIAAELNLSPKTVEVHRSHVMEKMQADSLADLVRMAVMLEDDVVSGHS